VVHPVKQVSYSLYRTPATCVLLTLFSISLFSLWPLSSIGRIPFFLVLVPSASLAFLCSRSSKKKDEKKEEWQAGYRQTTLCPTRSTKLTASHPHLRSPDSANCQRKRPIKAWNAAQCIFAKSARAAWWADCRK
jgi:hypothetical protein